MSPPRGHLVARRVLSPVPLALAGALGITGAVWFALFAVVLT